MKIKKILVIILSALFLTSFICRASYAADTAAETEADDKITPTEYATGKPPFV